MEFFVRVNKTIRNAFSTDYFKSAKSTQKAPV